MIEKNFKRFQRTAIDWKQNLLNLELNDKDNFFKQIKKTIQKCVLQKAMLALMLSKKVVIWSKYGAHTDGKAI